MDDKKQYPALTLNEDHNSY